MTRRIPVPGVAEHGRALKTLVEAVFLRDHLLEQLDVADAEPDAPAGRAERAALLTVVAVGAGYTGTELVAQTQRWLRTIERRWRRTGADDVRWVLVDAAPDGAARARADLGRRTLALLRRRGVDVRLEVSRRSADDEAVRLSDGTTRGHPDAGLGRRGDGPPARRRPRAADPPGRLVVDADLSVPGAPACGRPGTPPPSPTWPPAAAGDLLPDTPPTAQHAQRQGTVMGRDVAASLGWAGPALPAPATWAWSPTSAAGTPSPGRSASR